jgi:hypothetical protein
MAGVLNGPRPGENVGELAPYYAACSDIEKVINARSAKNRWRATWILIRVHPVL